MILTILNLKNPQKCLDRTNFYLFGLRRTRKGILSQRGGEPGRSGQRVISGSMHSLPCAPSTSGHQYVTETVQDIGSLIQEVQDLLGPAIDPAPSHWKDRKASTLEKWTVLRPYMVNQMLQSEKPIEGTCHHCRSKTAVVKCQDCLPRPLHCAACDVSIHNSMVLHNRSSMIEGFYRPLPPTTHIREEKGGKFSFNERECILPVMHPCCDCCSGQTTFSAGKQVILIGMNGDFLVYELYFLFSVLKFCYVHILGRYNVSLPTVSCSCGKALDVGISELIESGYWPATVNFETMYTVDLFATYEDLKITAPGMS
ncbi:uncharacterized protein LOC128766146 isoform X2 [Synchiropus splendidus]|uniref:uncharacterized protein LOC128766146 isoform X2 n=1 Tax=Synchiropus splendidus TaxID=270530 RepID=UPI00237D7D77|nr:uncharacterized protein LOC128766146 isoform X2 [Synchiropus splendidus]